MNKQQIVDLIREKYDPIPSDWPRHRVWDDGADDIADAILSKTESVPSRDEGCCPKCNLEAGSLLHRFCTHNECPVRTAALHSPKTAAADDVETCIACDIAFVEGDMVYPDASGGSIHASCCGPEMESYVNADGDPLPTPQRWTSAAAETSPGDVLAMKEACKRAVTELDCMYINDERVPYGGIPADPESSVWREAIKAAEAAIDRLDVAEAKSEAVQDTWFTDSRLPVVAMSGDVESDRVLKLHFRRPVTDQDRIDLTDAMNMKILTEAKSQEPEAGQLTVREFREDAFRSMEVQICGDTRTVQFGVEDHGGDHPTMPCCAVSWTDAADLASWIQSCTAHPTTKPEAPAVSVDAIKAAMEPVFSFLDELAANAEPSQRHALNPILIGGSAKLYAEGARSAIAALIAGGR